MSDDFARPDFASLALDAPDPTVVAATVRSRLQARARRRRNLAVLGTVAAVVAVGTVTLLIRGVNGQVEVAGGDRPSAEDRPAVLSSSARCYASADLGIDELPLNWFGISYASKDENEIVAAAPFALERCTEAWTSGTFKQTPPYANDPPVPTTQIPDLVMCILPPAISGDGMSGVAVFPGDSTTCATLGLLTY